MFYILGGLLCLYFIDKYLLINRYDLHYYRGITYIRFSALLIVIWMFFSVILVYFMTEDEGVKLSILNIDNND